MFDRIWAKTVAKNRLRLGRGDAILVMLILTLLGAVTGGIDFSLNFNSDTGSEVTYSTPLDETTLHEFVQEFMQPHILIPMLIGLCVALVFAVCLTFFFTNILATGGRGWYLRYVRGASPSVGEAFASFRIYKPVLCTTGLRSLYTFLWSLLFVIPGIIKSYAYSMADYIIYENPNLPASQALRLSEKLTDGAKGDLFVFDLSYLGWNILDAFTAGILGVVYVNPYRYTAHAAIYDSLKWRAISSGVLTWEDFGQQPPAPAEPPQPGAYYTPSQPGVGYGAPQPGAYYTPPQPGVGYTAPQPGAYYTPPQPGTYYPPQPVAPQPDAYYPPQPAPAPVAPPPAAAPVPPADPTETN